MEWTYLVVSIWIRVGVAFVHGMDIIYIWIRVGVAFVHGMDIIYIWIRSGRGICAWNGHNLHMDTSRRGICAWNRHSLYMDTSGRGICAWNGHNLHMDTSGRGICAWNGHNLHMDTSGRGICAWNGHNLHMDTSGRGICAWNGHNLHMGTSGRGICAWNGHNLHMDTSGRGICAWNGHNLHMGTSGRGICAWNGHNLHMECGDFMKSEKVCTPPQTVCEREGVLPHSHNANNFSNGGFHDLCLLVCKIRKLLITYNVLAKIMELVFASEWPKGDPNAWTRKWTIDPACSWSCRNIIAFSGASGCKLSCVNDGESQGGKIHIVDPDRPWEVHSFSTGHTDIIRCIKWDVSGSRIVSSDSSGTCKLWIMNNYLINDWKCGGESKVEGETIIALSWLHIGYKINYNVERTDSPNVMEKFSRVKFLPSVLQYGGKSIEGWIVITMSGVEFSQFNDHHNCVQLDLGKLLIAGHILVCVSNGSCRCPVQVYKLTVKLNKDKCSIDSEALPSLFMQCSTDPNQLEKWPHGACIESWHLKRESLNVHKIFQASSPPRTRDQMPSILKWNFMANYDSDTCNVMALSLPKLPLNLSHKSIYSGPGMAFSAAFQDGTIKLIHRVSLKPFAVFKYEGVRPDTAPQAAMSNSLFDFGFSQTKKSKGSDDHETEEVPSKKQKYNVTSSHSEPEKLANLTKDKKYDREKRVRTFKSHWTTEFPWNQLFVMSEGPDLADYNPDPAIVEWLLSSSTSRHISGHKLPQPKTDEHAPLPEIVSEKVSLKPFAVFKYEGVRPDTAPQAKRQKNTNNGKQLFCIEMSVTCCSLIGVDKSGSLCLIKIAPTLGQSVDQGAARAHTIAQVVNLIEYCMVTGYDWWDLLLTITPGMVDTVIDRLSEAFNRQPKPLQELLFTRLTAVKATLYRLNPGTTGKLADCHAKLLLNGIAVSFKSLLRPTNLSSQDKGLADKLSAVCSRILETDLDKVMMNLDTKEFVIEPATVQSLQQLIQWVADFALFLLSSVPLQQPHCNRPGVSMLRDPGILCCLREMLVIIRVWGLINTTCQPIFTSTSDNVDGLSTLFKLLTQVWLCCKDDTYAEFDDSLIDECILLPSQLLVPTMESLPVVEGITGRSFIKQAMSFHFESTTVHVSHVTSFNPSATPGTELSTRYMSDNHSQKHDVVRRIYLGVAPHDELKQCTRCSCISLVKSNAKTGALKAWDARWIKSCVCGGQWRRVTASTR
uniref:Mediator of RNA polymerase II transcription subunit 16 n=1 Tax=Saccoglossus kowalevskii TaxID=10224 RepID=A0ABM0MYT3_SACKO|nr:PREDICTED: mediator of RNA polymerase II transcription subunit 16-like [Saccoglossus kowalevskii]